jgi:hypothetical protein
MRDDTGTQSSETSMGGHSRAWPNCTSISQRSTPYDTSSPIKNRMNTRKNRTVADEQQRYDPRRIRRRGRFLRALFLQRRAQSAKGYLSSMCSWILGEEVGTDRFIENPDFWPALCEGDSSF